METALRLPDLDNSGSESVNLLREDINTRLEYGIDTNSEERICEFAKVDSLQTKTSVSSGSEDTILDYPVRPLPEPLKGNFKLLQFWEGIVSSIDDNREEFIARISDKSDPANADEEITLSMDEVDPNDMPLLAPGAVFYWSIGYADYPGRPRTRESRIKFRRLRQWTRLELNVAEEQGKQLADFFASC